MLLSRSYRRWSHLVRRCFIGAFAMQSSWWCWRSNHILVCGYMCAFVHVWLCMYSSTTQGQGILVNRCDIWLKDKTQVQTEEKGSKKKMKHRAQIYNVRMKGGGGGGGGAPISMLLPCLFLSFCFFFQVFSTPSFSPGCATTICSDKTGTLNTECHDSHWCGQCPGWLCTGETHLTPSPQCRCLFRINLR